MTVLTSSNWPSYPSIAATLPKELLGVQRAFQEFYSINHRGRKLLWQPTLGHCLLRCAFPAGDKELQVSLLQAAVLLLFGEVDRLTCAEIAALTEMEERELKRTLVSLACGKHRVLVKRPKGPEIGKEDEFRFNGGFAARLFRVKINRVLTRETAEERAATEKGVMQDRQFQVDAAIVRIMKREKVMHHNVLMSQLYKAMDVPVDPVSLKKRIEQLIEREYIERDAANPATYKYVA